MFAALGLALGFNEVQAADSRRSVSQALQSLPDAFYIGGMPSKAGQIAAWARLELQTWRGEALPTCEAPDPRQGSVVATGVGVDSPESTSPASPLLSELQGLLRHERRVVRDAAADVIGEIGPAAATLEPDLSGSDIHRSPWFTHALGRISCQSFAMNGDVAFIPAEARFKLTGTDETSPSLGLKVRLLALLLDDKQLHWPDGFFSSLIDPWELREKDGSLEQIKPGSVLAIVERVMDESAPQALRGDLLELLNSLDKAAGPASEQLWELANRPNDKLSLPAAQVVMRVGSAHALDAAVLLLERSDIELSMLPQSLCSTPNAAVLLGPPAKKRLSGINWSEAGEAAKWLGCLDPIGNAALL